MTEGGLLAALGTKPKSGRVKTFSCPSCGGTITLRAAGISITAICQSCGSIVDVANQNAQLLSKAGRRTHSCVLPLGTRGVLFGVTWEVIGYTQFSDGTGQYQWHEYLLFNPYHGFRFLVSSDGHWNFVRMLRAYIPSSGEFDTLQINNRTYLRYTRGRAVVQYVMGEFYWRVKIKDTSQVADYISPPYMLSVDRSEGDIIWSLGTYVDSEIIRMAFIPKSAISDPVGIAPNQPSPFEEKYKRIGMPMLLFCIGLIVLQAIAVYNATNRLIYQNTVHVTSANQGQPAVADLIDVEGGMGNLEIKTSSPLDNNWVEINASLVNEATGKSADFRQTMEFYHGYDSDGSWSEGSPSASSLLSGVPAGKYRLVLEPEAGAVSNYRTYYGYQTNQNPFADITVQVLRNVPIWSNFFVALLLLTIYPLCIMLRRTSFETRRWANSDSAPLNRYAD